MTKDIIKSILNGDLYDYVATNYYAMSNSDLKNIILELEYAVKTNVDDTDYKQIHSDVATELLEYVD